MESESLVQGNAYATLHLSDHTCFVDAAVLTDLLASLMLKCTSHRIQFAFASVVDATSKLQKFVRIDWVSAVLVPCSAAATMPFA